MGEVRQMSEQQNTEYKTSWHAAGFQRGT